jgi:uncharacterized MAPEG superfamily protein
MQNFKWFKQLILKNEEDQMNELSLLAAITFVTAMMWIPYMLERIYQQGLMATLGYPKTQPSVSEWARRAQKAHINAIENLAVFGILVLIAQAVGVLSSLTLLAAQLFVTARVAHYIYYVLAIPWARTIAFLFGFIAQMIMALTILVW